MLLNDGGALQVERVVLHARPMQWSPHYQVPSQRLVLPASGATEFSFNGQAVLLDGITALCLPSGLPYRMKPLAEAARTSIVVSARAGAEDALPPPRAWLLSPRALLQLRRHWRALAREASVAVQYATPRVLRAVLEPGALAGASSPSNSSADRVAAAVHRAKSFMATRIGATDGDMAPWTLNDVADAACCSPFHLARTFHRATGLSLHGYRQRLRLAAALQRLEEGERDLAALAHDLGFSSQSHLGEAFRRWVGATPGSVRAELAG
ncbi:MAG: helix-turn-helix transcriptional regulator [Ramlibacter sp.]